MTLSKICKKKKKKKKKKRKKKKKKEEEEEKKLIENLNIQPVKAVRTAIFQIFSNLEEI